MNKLATLVIILATSACATTRTVPTLALESAPAAGTLDLTLAPDGVRRDALVMVSTAALPTANRMRRALISDGHAALTAELALCVAPDGAIIDVAIARSSGVTGFDDAVIRDAGAWRFAAYAAPAGLRVCQPLTVTFRP